MLSSGLGQVFGLVGLLVGLVGGSVLEHGEDDVGAAAGDADDGGVVAFALGSFTQVVGAGVGIVSGSDERGDEHSVFWGGGYRPWAVGWYWCGLIASRRGRGQLYAARRRGLAKRLGSPISARVRAPVRGPHPHIVLRTCSEGMLQERLRDVGLELVSAPGDTVQVGCEVTNWFAPGGFGDHGDGLSGQGSPDGVSDAWG